MSRWAFAAIALAVAAACVGGGLYVALHFATVPVIEYYETLSWRSVSATVVKLRLENSSNCYVTYNFTVDSVVYEGNHTRTIGHHNHYEDHGHTELCRELNHTRALNAIHAWYDPSNPYTNALKITFVGDLWLAIHSFDSLALVSLGGALTFWVTRYISSALLLTAAHAALIALSVLPISIYRITDGYLSALAPLLSGVACAVLTVLCLMQLRCGSKADNGFSSHERLADSWWDSPNNQFTP